MKGKWSWEWFWTWTVVYILNLPLVLYFGIDKSLDFGRLGVVLAVFLLWFFGVNLHTATRRFKVAFCLGATLVAIAQFFPVIQVGCGIIAFGTFEFVTRQDFTYAKIDAFFAEFALTVITVQLLFIVSLMIGFSIMWMFGTTEYLDRLVETSSLGQADKTEVNDQSPDFPSPTAS